MGLGEGLGFGLVLGFVLVKGWGLPSRDPSKLLWRILPASDRKIGVSTVSTQTRSVINGFANTYINE